MKKISTILWICLLAISTANSYAVESDKTLPADMPVVAPEAFDGYDAVVLLDSIRVVVEPTGSGTFDIIQKIRIQTEKGAVSNRIVKYDYDPLTAHAEFRYAIIYRANGDVINLDVTQACDYAAPARAIYWGARQIMLEVGRLNIGDVIEYKIAKKGFTYALLQAQDDEERFIPPMRGQFYDIVPFWVNDPTERKVYSVSLPKEKDLQFTFYQGSCESSVSETNDRKEYRFVTVNTIPFKREAAMVDLFDAAPKLFMSTTPSWVEKSLWFHGVNEDYGSFAAYGPAQKKVNEIIKGKKTDMEKIAALTHWVADNIRYSGISMGKGEGFTLHNTEMNFTDRCGVCKDIAGMLVSFLRMAGFEAYPAMTMAGSRVEKIPADHFNHCVAVVKVDGAYMPLDPTWVPFTRELWSSAEQQQNYLPGIPEGTDIRETPLSPPEDHYVRIRAKNKIDVDGTLRGEFTIKAEGQSDRSIRNIFTQGWQTEWKKSMESQLLAVSPQAKLIKVKWGKNPKDYQAAPIAITFVYEIPNYAVATGSELVFKPMTLNNLYNQVKSYLRIDTSAEERQYDFKDACSRLVELEETIQLPKGYTLIGEAKKERMFSGAADFEGSLSQEGNKITLKNKLALKKRVYAASDWDGFRKAVEAHKSYNDFIVVTK